MGGVQDEVGRPSVVMAVQELESDSRMVELLQVGVAGSATKGTEAYCSCLAVTPFLKKDALMTSPMAVKPELVNARSVWAVVPDGPHFVPL